jgi:DNA-directed RNA polymerase subunit D
MHPSIFQKVQRPRDGTLQFQMAPTNVAYANTLRRLCMTHVETVGFRADIKDDGETTDVEVQENTTPMTNEMLAHRFGLLPIHIGSPLQWDPTKYTFILNASNESEHSLDVFASDIQVLENRGEQGDVRIPSNTFFPPNPVTRDTSLIATLKPMMPGGKPEEIRIKAKASLGVGRENARFIPTSQCAYGYTRNPDPEAQKKTFEEWLIRSKMIADPASLDTDPEKKGPLIREFKTLETNRCYLKDETTGEANSFDFTVESVGVLDPAYILMRACEAGVKLSETYGGESLPTDVIVQPIEGLLRGFDFFFQRQDHTLGHLVQAWIDEHLMGGGSVTFVGYEIPHPLRDEMVLRVGIASGEEAEARDALRKAMGACRSMFVGWRDYWLSQQSGVRTTGSVAGVTQTQTATQGPAQTQQAKRTVLRRPGAPGATTAATAATPVNSESKV